jgi:hypothetical protein
VRPNRLTLLIAGIVAGSLVVAGVLVLHSTGSAPRDASQPAPSPTKVVPAVTTAQYDAAEPAVRQLLARRAAAIRDHDETAWLADVDSRDPAFVARQTRLYENISKLAFSAWSYHLTDQHYGLPDLGSRYGGPSFLRIVVLHYALAGYDPASAARPQGLTFVQRQGRWLLASDSDIDKRLQISSFREPWEGAPIDVASSAHAVVITSTHGPLDPTKVLTTVDRAIARVARSWTAQWSKRVVLVAVRDKDSLTSFFRPGLVPDNLAAVHFSLPRSAPQLESPSSARGRAAQRVVIFPSYLRNGVHPLVLIHELTHVATAGVGRTAPTWLVEGFADDVATRRLGDALIYRQADLTQILRRGPVALPADGSFRDGEIGAHYELSNLACRYIARTYGQARLVALYADWDRIAGSRTDPAARQDRALRTELGVGTRTLERGFDGWLRTL